MPFEQFGALGGTASLLLLTISPPAYGRRQTGRLFENAQLKE